MKTDALGDVREVEDGYIIRHWYFNSNGVMVLLGYGERMGKKDVVCVSMS